MRIILFIVAVIISTGCSITPELDCPEKGTLRTPALSMQEYEALQEMSDSGKYDTACVTAATEEYKLNRCTECQLYCEGMLRTSIKYQQWLSIYNSCSVP
jgi:hypothetical protein